jgi:hypothetical protein
MKQEHEMEYRLQCRKTFAEVLDCMTRNSRQSVIGHLWGIVFDGTYMFEGVTEDDVFIPVNKRVEYSGRGDYKYVTTGEILMERAALCFDNDETIIRRINEDIPRGYDIDMCDDPGMTIFTDSLKVYEWLKPFAEDLYPKQMTDSP